MLKKCVGFSLKQLESFNKPIEELFINTKIEEEQLI